MDHGILFSKLTIFGVVGKRLRWFTSYLTDGKEHYQMDSQESSLKMAYPFSFMWHIHSRVKHTAYHGRASSKEDGGWS